MQWQSTTYLPHPLIVFFFFIIFLANCVCVLQKIKMINTMVCAAAVQIINYKTNEIIMQRGKIMENIWRRNSSSTHSSRQQYPTQRDLIEKSRKKDLCRYIACAWYHSIYFVVLDQQNRRPMRIIKSVCQWPVFYQLHHN